MIKDPVTETLIKEKAKILFFQKGLLDATTQEIADEAGVNRALIHYYFRSKEHLLETVLEEAITSKRNKVREIFNSNLSFREKIATYISVIVDRGIHFPYLENFIVNETARNPEKVKSLCAADKIKSADLIRPGLEAEIALGTLSPIAPTQFMVNLSAMCNYPLLAKAALKSIHGMTDQEYRKFLLDRKQVIYRTIFNEEMVEVKPDPELKSILS